MATRSRIARTVFTNRPVFSTTQELLNGFLCLKAGSNPGPENISFMQTPIINRLLLDG